MNLYIVLVIIRYYLFYKLFICLLFLFTFAIIINIILKLIDSINSNMLGCLGNLIIVFSLVFQAYILFENQTIAQQFNQRLTAALQACKCVPDHIAAHILEHARLVVVGLLASSALIVISRCWFFKLLPLLALSTLLYI